MTWRHYIIQCRDGTLYTGITNSLEKRILDHNLGKGCRYTRFRRPVRLVYSETLPSRSAALKRESRIQGLSRAEKMSLIAKGC